MDNNFHQIFKSLSKSGASIDELTKSLKVFSQTMKDIGGDYVMEMETQIIYDVKDMSDHYLYLNLDGGHLFSLVRPNLHYLQWMFLNFISWATVSSYPLIADQKKCNAFLNKINTDIERWGVHYHYHKGVMKYKILANPGTKGHWSRLSDLVVKRSHG